MRTRLRAQDDRQDELVRHFVGDAVATVDWTEGRLGHFYEWRRNVDVIKLSPASAKGFSTLGYFVWLYV